MRFLLLPLFLLSLPGVPSARAQVDTQPPTIVNRSPSPGVNGQPVYSIVTATFSEPVQPASIVFVLRDSANNVVAASLNYDPSTFTATLDPGADLIPSRTYTVTVSGATDLAGNPMSTPSVWSFSTGQPGFHESVIFSGLDKPTAFQFAPDGRVFVAEKSGLIWVYPNLGAGTRSVFADLRTNVHNFGSRGLLGMALDPGFPAVPYVYVFYTYDAPIGGVAPTWGTPGASADTCPDPGGACVVSGRLSRLQANGNVMTAEQVLVEDWYQRYPDQSVGNLAFGPDGNLYAAAGDGASSTIVDLGQTDVPSPDPPNEGGALRSQDLRTPADAVTLDGSIIRVQPDTGKPVRKTASMAVGTPTVDGNGVKSYPVTSVYQGPESSVVRVLEPTNPAPGRPRRFLYVLPVESGVTNLSSAYSDGLEELRLLDVPNRFNLTLIAPSFNYEPWYGDHATDQTRWMESFIIRDLVPFGDSFAAVGEIPQRFVLGFSKSGNGSLFLILRHPNVFSAAAAWDAPAQVTDITRFAGLSLNFGTQANFDLYGIPGLVVTSAQAFTLRNRLWISGDDSLWTGDMVQLHSQMTNAAIVHTWVQGGFRQHNWGSGWLDGAVTALDANATAVAPVDVNEQRIVAYGLRNPRLTFRPGTQEIWVADRGWNSWEEIDRIPNATEGDVKNFGWPCYEGNAATDYSVSGICTLLYSQPAAATAPYYTYNHQQQVVTGNEAGVGSGAISGLAFYDSGSYPADYQGALFFSDYLRNHIWVMFKGANGLPDPANRATFLLGAASPVDLKTGPGGDLFYADLNGGTIRRITYEAVIRSNGQPSGVLPAGVGQTILSLTTDINATCRYATAAGVPYASMPNTFGTTGGTAHSSSITGLVNGVSYSYYVRCQDTAGHANTEDFQITFTVASADTAPPVRSNGQPAGILAAGTSQTGLTLVTNENATCRYATTAGVGYASMPNTFTTTGATAHATTVTGLVSGASYSYYVRCLDGTGNANPDDFVIAFSVATGGPTATSSFSGTESPLFEGGMWDSPGAASDLRKDNGAYAVDSYGLARLATPTMAADQYSEITYSQDPGSLSWVGVTTRVQGAANGSGYLAIAYGGGVRLYRVDDTGSLSFTQLAAATVDIAAAPRRLRLESQGANHRVYFNGVQVINATGTLYPAGQPGIAAAVFGGPAVKILSFEGGSIGEADTTPPLRSNGQPAGPLTTGTTQAALSLTTNESATCRYAAAAGVAYGSMPNTFATTGGTAHATTVTGLVNGGSYNYYVRCQDIAANANTDDFVITFSVATGGGSRATSIFSGIESPLSEGGMWDSPGAASDLRKDNGAYTVDSYGHARLVTPAIAADQYSEITYSQSPGASGWVGVSTRVQGAANGSCYLAIADGGGVSLYRVDDSGSVSFTRLGAATVDVAAAPRRLRLESEGDRHRVYFNGVQVINTGETLYSAGQPGIAASFFGGSTVKILSFDGGSIGPADITPPLRSNGQPAGSLTAGTTQATLSLTTDENAACRYATAAGVAYAAMPNTFTATGGTAHSTTVTGLVNGGSYNYYVRCQDISANANPDDFPITFTVALVADTTPPLRANGTPMGTLPAGTTQATLTIATNENATCRYATSRLTYAAMPNLFTTTGGTAHSTLVTGLVNGRSYAYYVRCQDAAGNTNTDDFTISFMVAQGADTTPPVQANGAPSGILPAGTTVATLRLATNENATCRYSTSMGIAYAAMPNLFTTTGGTAHSSSVTGLVNGGSYSYYVRCQDAVGNANTSDFPITFTVAQPADTTPPVPSSGQPAGTLPAGTSQTSLTLATNENAACRYATTPGVLYGSMPNTFTTTGATAHATTVSGLVNGRSYSYYVRCQDSAGNANNADFVITFSIALGGSTVTSTFSGVESPLSEGGMWDSPGAASDLRKNNGAYTVDSYGHARLVTPAIAADQFSEITYSQDPGSSSWVGVTTRVQGAANGSCYLAIAHGVGVSLYRVDDTGSVSFTRLGAATVDIAAAPRRLRLESEGDRHRVYFNGVQVINTGETLYSAGQPGIAASFFGGPTVNILTFEGGAITPP